MLYIFDRLIRTKLAVQDGAQGFHTSVCADYMYTYVFWKIGVWKAAVYQLVWGGYDS